MFADLQEAGKKEGTTGISGSVCEGDPVTLTQDIWKGKDEKQHINLFNLAFLGWVEEHKIGESGCLENF